MLLEVEFLQVYAKFRSRQLDRKEAQLRQRLTRLAESLRRETPRPDDNLYFPVEAARKIELDRRARRRDRKISQMKIILGESPEISSRKLAVLLGISPTTAGDYRRQIYA